MATNYKLHCHGEVYTIISYPDKYGDISDSILWRAILTFSTSFNVTIQRQLG